MFAIINYCIYHIIIYILLKKNNTANSIPSKLNTRLSTSTTAKLCPVSSINFAWKCYKCQVLNVQKILLLLHLAISLQFISQRVVDLLLEGGKTISTVLRNNIRNQMLALRHGKASRNKVPTFEMKH